jgi:hypothetical protein
MRKKAARPASPAPAASAPQAPESAPPALPDDPSKLPVDPGTLLPEISPLEVHQNIMRCKALGNQVDRKMLEWLRILLLLDDYTGLNVSGPLHYAKKELHCGKSLAHEVICVARALPRIPLAAGAYDRNEIGWGQLHAIAQVVDTGKENEWLLSRARDKSHYPACRIIPLQAGA